MWSKIETTKGPNKDRKRDYSYAESDAGKENIDTHDVVSVPITPYKFESSKYSARYDAAKHTDKPKSTHKEPKKNTLEVKKYLNFSNN